MVNAVFAGGVSTTTGASSGWTFVDVELRVGMAPVSRFDRDGLNGGADDAGRAMRRARDAILIVVVPIVVLLHEDNNIDHTCESMGSQTPISNQRGSSHVADAAGCGPPFARLGTGASQASIQGFFVVRSRRTFWCSAKGRSKWNWLVRIPRVHAPTQAPAPLQTPTPVVSFASLAG